MLLKISYFGQLARRIILLMNTLCVQGILYTSFCPTSAQCSKCLIYFLIGFNHTTRKQQCTSAHQREFIDEVIHVCYAMISGYYIIQLIQLVLNCSCVAGVVFSQCRGTQLCVRILILRTELCFYRVLVVLNLIYYLYKWDP